MPWVWSDELAALLEDAGADERVVDGLRTATFGIAIRRERSGADLPPPPSAGGRDDDER